MQKNIVCVKWGPKYIPQYVNILKNMCKRNSTVDYKFSCITDNPEGLDSDINIIHFPKDNLAIKSWWSKLYMFARELPLDGTILYFDLDVVIFRNIDYLWTFEPGKFCIIQDFNRCRVKDWHVCNSSVMRWEAGSLEHLWQIYMQDPGKVWGRNHGDQDFITAKEGQTAKRWPTNWIMSYKWEMQGKKDTKIRKGAKYVFEHPPTIPDDCSVAVFHGEPKPFNCADQLIVDNWK